MRTCAGSEIVMSARSCGGYVKMSFVEVTRMVVFCV